MNDRIATWVPTSPPGEWAATRTNWTRWNHVRTTAPVVAFALYVAAIATVGL
jgi:uncharacterized membrane protein